MEYQRIKKITMEIAKCITSDFLTGFIEVITMPVTLPANVGSVLYVQMRMIACVAYRKRYELEFLLSVGFLRSI